MSRALRTVVSLTALAVAGAPLLVGALVPASAVGPASATSTVLCTTPAARTVPHYHGQADVPVTQGDLAALPAEQTRPRVVRRQVLPALPATVVVPVYMHVIKGRHKGEKTIVGPVRARNLVTLLNNGMGGRQSSLSAPARYRFTLKRVDYRKNESWYHAFFNGPRDQRMKRKLHRGNASTLNLYINGGGPRNNPVLGWSRFPWQYASAPFLDGVSVNAAALPGGKASGYNLGDTVIHETGHWLGLFHTFQGGCTGSGDLVSDTPPEAEPSFYCETTRDSCTSPGLDPVHNFMDYSLDSCMNMFTAGQVLRMDVAFEKWRL